MRLAHACLLGALAPALAYAQAPASPGAEPEAAAEELKGEEVVTVIEALPPGSAQVVDGKQLERFELDDVHKVLRDVPGVYVRQEDGYGLRPNIGMRGTGTERSAKIALLENDVPIAPAPYSTPAAYVRIHAPCLDRVDDPRWHPHGLESSRSRRWIMQLSIEAGQLHIKLHAIERLLAFRLKDTVAVPLEHIEHVSTDKPPSEWRQIRAPGTFVPGVIKAGTYYTRRGREFWYARRKPAGFLVLDLKDDRFKRIVLTTEDSAEWAKKLAPQPRGKA